MSEVIDAQTGELVPYEAPSVTLFRSDHPEEIIQRATDTANALIRVVRAKKLTAKIQNKDYPLVEAWTLCGTLLGVFPVCVWTRKLEDGWEARVEARTLAGQVVGAAEAQCTRAESTWARRDEYALRSMAQTRATSKALRQPLGFVMTMAGLESTPAEEMIGIDQPAPAPAPAPSQFKAPAPKKGTISDKTREWLDDIIGRLTKGGALDAVKIAERMKELYGTSLTAELTQEQGSELLGKLKEIEDKLA